MFKPVKVPLKAYEGVTFEKALRFRDSHNNIIPLTGFTARLEVRLSADDNTEEGVLLALTTENGGLIVNGELGKLTILVDNPILGYNGVYDIFLYRNSNTYYPILPSPFKVASTVTVTP